MKKIMLWSILIIILSCIVSADSFEANYTTVLNAYETSDGSTNIWVSQLKYEPYPVNPGEYFTLWIKAEVAGTKLTEDAVFELVPKYPFSLDSNEDPVRRYGQLNSEPVVMEYKIRVDKDAVEGANEIDVRYKTGPKDSWNEKTFEIEVDDAQTDFDLVVQEINGNEATIAIANTGKNAAYSVIVRVPEQEFFEAIGTSGQMVGNLEDGDYTLVSFEIAGKQSEKASGKKTLKFQIDYSDNIGERRSLIKEVPFGGNNRPPLFSDDSASSLQSSSRMRGMNAAPQQSMYQEWWFWAIVVVLAYAGLKGYGLYKKKRQEKEEKKAKK